MKAAVFREIGQPLAVEEVPKPSIGPDEVLVETRTCGICRTCIFSMDWPIFQSSLISQGMSRLE